MLAFWELSTKGLRSGKTFTFFLWPSDFKILFTSSLFQETNLKFSANVIAPRRIKKWTEQGKPVFVQFEILLDCYFCYAELTYIFPILTVKLLSPKFPKY